MRIRTTLIPTLAVVASLVFPLLGAATAHSEARSGDLYAAEKRRAAGSVTLATAPDGAPELQLSRDFSTPRGPDLFVVLIEHDRPRSGRQVRDAGYVALGRLQSNGGAQRYAVPEDLDLARYGSVGIWCEEYGVLFSAATLRATTE